MSSKPMRLDKAFQKGRVVQFKLKPTEKAVVPFGCAWLILNGLVNHVTGTESKTSAFNNTPMVWRTIIDSAVASGLYPLFNAVADVQVSLYTPIFLSWGEKDLNLSNVYFQGAVNSYLKVQILEWEL